MPRSTQGAASTSTLPRQQDNLRRSSWSPGPPSPEDVTLFNTLSAYADALDALPLDLTRSFSDLRELDAVLGAHLSSLTNRLVHLTALIEDQSFTAGERILALKEVAEEARAYKMGGEDKIRVALNTAETIISHTTYIDTLLSTLSSISSLAPLLNPPSQSHMAGHLSDGTPLAPGSGPGGNNPANVVTLTEIVTPNNKRKRPAPPGAASGAPTPQSLPAANNTTTSVDKRAAQESAAQATTPSNAAVKRRKPASQANAVKANKTVNAANQASSAAVSSAAYSNPIKGAATNVTEVGDEVESNKKAAATKRRKEEEDHEEVMAASAAAAARARMARAGRASHAQGNNGTDDEEAGDSEQDASIGRPARVSRAPRLPNGSQDAEVVSTLPPSHAILGEETDERRYCFCNNVSYGDMIGCDDDDCLHEWFHLGCVGLLKPPQGTWYCNDCAQKRMARNGKSKKTKVARTTGSFGGGVLETKTSSSSSRR